MFLGRFCALVRRRREKWVKMDGWKKAVAAAESWRERFVREITATIWNQSSVKVLTNLISAECRTPPPLIDST